MLYIPDKLNHIKFKDSMTNKHMQSYFCFGDKVPGVQACLRFDTKLRKILNFSTSSLHPSRAGIRGSHQCTRLYDPVDQTHGFVQAGQALYQMSSIPMALY